MGTSEGVGWEPCSVREVPRLLVDAEQARDGLTLISPMRSYWAALIDEHGQEVHVWECNTSTQVSTYMLDDGSILRGMAKGGTGSKDLGVEMLSWDGDVLWEYFPPKPLYRHHDIELLPNGNVLMMVRRTLTSEQAFELGRDPEVTNVSFWVDLVIEVRPNGTAGGDIVWKWDPSDHLVQDRNASWPNYGNVSEHPELLDVNVPFHDTIDWVHMNSVDYSPELDQIVLTSRNYNELWVLDHSTTMEEAAGHEGGDQGRGGDILYRWGNPLAYGAGDPADRVLHGPHDAQWIEPGLPGEGNILVFNNGNNQWDARPEGRFSSVEELEPPVNGSGGYDHVLGTPFGPSDVTWRYVADPPTDFYAIAMSGAQRLPDGNTLVCSGVQGRIFEVTPDGETVWTHFTTNVFKVHRYYPPLLDPLEDHEAVEDVPSVVDLGKSLWDPETGTDGLTLETDSPYCSVSGLDLRMLYPEGVLEDVVGITVSDGVFGTRSELRVHVTAVNDPPVLSPLPDLDLFEDVPHRFDLSPYIQDPDDPMGEMVVEVDSAHVTCEGTMLELVYPEGVLDDVVGISVSDGEYEASAELRVTIARVNDPPKVSFIPDQAVVEDLPFLLDLSPYLSDVDTAMTGLTLVSHSRYASVEGQTVCLTYPDGVTSERVHLTVSDGGFEVAFGFNVTCRSVNDGPEWATVPQITATEDRAILVDLSPFISDVDNPIEDLVLEVSSPFVDVAGRTIVLTYPEGVLEDHLAITVSDGELSADVTIAVVVIPVNDPPTWTRVLKVSPTGGEPGEVDLTPYIHDPDTALEELEVTGGSAYAAVTGHTLSFLYPEWVMEDELVLTLSDGEFEDVLRTLVSVTFVNDPPELLDARVTPVEGGGGLVLLFSVVVVDQDAGHDAPTVTVLIDGEAHTCPPTGPSIDGPGTVHSLMVALPPGEHTYVFTADDGNGGVATTDTYDLRVSKEGDPGGLIGNPAPYLLALLVAVGLVIAIIWTRRSR